MKIFHHINPEFNSNPNEFEETEEIILKPGDCLYFPSGHWHKVECLEDSISINVSLFSQKWSDIVCSAIHCLLNKDLKWRKGILINNENESKEYLSNLLNDLKKKIEILRTDDIMPNSIFMPRDEHQNKKDEKIKFDLNSKFRMNPISVLIYSNQKYIIHNNFGNEDVSSIIRIELNIKKDLNSILDWIRIQKDFFYLKDFPDIKNLKFEKIENLIRVLCFNGLISLD